MTGAVHDDEGLKGTQYRWVSERPFWETFKSDVWVQDRSITPVAGWFIVLLIGLVTWLTAEYAPCSIELAGSTPKPDQCEDISDQAISAQMALTALLGVAALTVLIGLEPIFAQLLGSWWSGVKARLTPRGTFVGRTLSGIWWILTKLPAFILSLIDWFLVRCVAIWAGTSIPAWPVRYLVMVVLLSGAIALGWVASGVMALTAINVGIVIILAIVRRWQWIERDREVFLTERQQSPERMRVGFAEDLRDEAMIALLFLFLLAPLGLRQADLVYNAFSLTNGAVTADTAWGEFIQWLTFFGAELMKSVPFVDWSEVFNVKNGTDFEARSPLGAQLIFVVRASLDLLLLAALLQAASIASRARKQNEAFFEGLLPILDPFSERRYFSALGNRMIRPPSLALAYQHEIASFPNYEAKELHRIAVPATQGQARAKIMRDADARIAAITKLTDQYERGDPRYSDSVDTPHILTTWLNDHHRPLETDALAARIALALARNPVAETQDGSTRPTDDVARERKDRGIAILRFAERLPEKISQSRSEAPEIAITAAYACALMATNAENGLTTDDWTAAADTVPDNLTAFADARLLRQCLPDAPGLFAVVEKGTTFRMGSEDGHGHENERPPRDVTFQHAFAIARFPVTFAEYDAFAHATGRPLPWDRGMGRERRPAINVSWNDAQAYCAWLSGQTGQQWRLLCEAEWEAACRSGTTTDYAFGDMITTDQANFAGSNSGGIDRRKTTPAGMFLPNAWGLYDMHGNVWEWCADHWHENYRGAPNDGTAWLTETDSTPRVLRGGSGDYSPRYLRSAFRIGYDPGVRIYDFGFRIARTL